MINLNELKNEIHQTAIEKGWWDNERNFDEMVALFHSEVSEAFEIYRRNKPLTAIWYETDSDGNQKPEGIVVDLADLIIRILDYYGHMNDDYADQDYEMPRPFHFSAFIARLHFLISAFYNLGKYHLDRCMMETMRFCDAFGLPLEHALKIKMEYNRTRSYRHGGKKA